MIVRAVADDEFTSVDVGASTARLVWIVTSTCGVVLLLVDLPSILSPSPSISLLLPRFLQQPAHPVDTTALANLVVGYLFGGFWVHCREQSLSLWTKALGWTVAVASVGNLALVGYVLRALLDADGDWTVFWLGRRRPRRSPTLHVFDPNV
ncbi:hypothetical protein H257_16645 [Aphanomyces astaci]|uniref:Uncharacterized protein n=1 Tax=Aphanomyces astaci TaxID=112090 RepID=W4FK63_APHAT|nr:hypothetical protein H257_16645 [Aphanomyces astaci]ETV67098.1 hypothetical protein H257_16645 [Aphanomyces astaci]|eukprot:XP_009843467.1 hypothetical protein H257_16645 [Aphanomyces astaci]